MSDWPFATLTPMKYHAILADPPWKYIMRSDKGLGKSPDAHYRTMPLEQIKALPVERLAGPQCYLFLWSTWPHLEQAMGLLEAWGFTYVTGGAWIKRTVNWKLAFGSGYVQRSSCEPYLIGRINAPEFHSRSERNVIDAPFEVCDVPDKIEALRREHSRKPDEMREMINRLLPRRWFCELFARQAWEGHDVWGDQAGLFDGARDE